MPALSTLFHISFKFFRKNRNILYRKKLISWFFVLYVDREFNLRIPCFFEIHVSSLNGSTTFHSAICCWMAQNLGPTRWTLLDLHDQPFFAVWYRDSRTALPKGGFFKVSRWRKRFQSPLEKICLHKEMMLWRFGEECNNFYRIRRVENNADELRTKFCARRNNQVN